MNVAVSRISQEGRSGILFKRLVEKAPLGSEGPSLRIRPDLVQIKRFLEALNTPGSYIQNVAVCFCLAACQHDEYCIRVSDINTMSKSIKRFDLIGRPLYR